MASYPLLAGDKLLVSSGVLAPVVRQLPRSRGVQPTSSVPSCPSLVAVKRPSFRLCSSSSRKSAGFSRNHGHRRKKIVQDKRNLAKDPDEGVPQAEDDALETLFSMLEEDLKNDEVYLDGEDDEITEEDLAKLEQELEAALNDEEEDVLSMFKNLEMENDEDEEEMIEIPKLKTWQLRRLASALKAGKRKTSIKNLAAELGLERAVILELLRDPPPDLLLMSAALPDKFIPSSTEAETQIVDNSPKEVVPALVGSSDAEVENAKDEEKEPVYIMRTRWSGQKRLKKVQLQTLERVYSRTKRPTNAMISSVVHVTNLPWKSVLKWFEERRLADGVADRRAPFHRETNK